MVTQSLQSDGAERLACVPFLVVEDDPASARLVATVLASEGATDVRVAHSAEDALAILCDGVVRVLIVDVILPGMSGLGLIRRLKSEQATRHIIAIAVSGWYEDAVATDALDSGCVAIMQKPIEFDELLAVLRASLARAAHGGGTGVTGEDS